MIFCTTMKIVLHLPAQSARGFYLISSHTAHRFYLINILSQHCVLHKIVNFIFRLFFWCIVLTMGLIFLMWPFISPFFVHILALTYQNKCLACVNLSGNKPDSASLCVWRHSTPNLIDISTSLLRSQVQRRYSEPGLAKFVFFVNHKTSYFWYCLIRRTKLMLTEAKFSTLVPSFRQCCWCKMLYKLVCTVTLSCVRPTWWLWSTYQKRQVIPLQPISLIH